MKTLLLSIVMILSASCGKERKRKVVLAPEKPLPIKMDSQLAELGQGDEKYVYLGDVQKIYEGTTRDTSGFSLEVLELIHESIILSWASFHSYMERPGPDYFRQNRMNQTPTETKKDLRENSKNAWKYIINRVSSNLKGRDGTYYKAAAIDLTDTKNNLTFRFVQMENSKFHLKYLTFKNGDNLQTFNVEPIHYSFNKEKKKLGVLFEVIYPIKDGPENKVLESVVFYKNENQKEFIPKENKEHDKYPYIFGYGQKVRWKNLKDNKIVLDDCGLTKSLAESVKQSIVTWNQALAEFSQMRLEFDQSKPVVPITDVNRNCVRFIKGYNDDPFMGNLAITNVTPDFLQYEIVSARMIIFEEGPAHYSLLDSNPDKHLSYEGTILHEMGHILGLHHPFSPHEVDVKSIMKWGYSSEGVTDYDKKILKALYTD